MGCSHDQSVCCNSNKLLRNIVGYLNTEYLDLMAVKCKSICTFTLKWQTTVNFPAIFMLYKQQISFYVIRLCTPPSWSGVAPVTISRTHVLMRYKCLWPAVDIRRADDKQHINHKYDSFFTLECFVLSPLKNSYLLVTRTVKLVFQLTNYTSTNLAHKVIEFTSQ